MLLPTSFNMFVQSNNARPYIQQVKGATNNSPYSDSFGLGGVFNADTSELRITIGQRTPGLEFKNVLSGLLGVYRVVSSGSDYLLKDIELSIDYLKKSKTDTYWEIVLRPQVPHDEIMLACTLVTTTGTVATWTPIDYEARTKEVNYFTERFRTSQDVLYENQPQTLVITPVETHTVVNLDFRNVEPVIEGDGVLTYQGGGNRYLLDKEYIGVLQELNQSPWSADCLCFVETPGRNYLTDSALIANTWRIHTSSVMSSVQKKLDLPAFTGYTALAYSVSSPLALDSVWEWESQRVGTTNQTHTGSMYFEYTSTSNLVLEVGLRIYTGTNTVIREVVETLAVDELKNLAMISITDPVSTPSNDVRNISVFVRVKQVCPGDRFECTLAMPQIENTSTSTSRIVGNQQRQADLITYTPASSVYDDLYGAFTCVVFPAWEGIPGGMNDQYLFDTRDVSKEAGFWCAIRANGFLEFGMCVDLVDTHVIQSASSISVGFNSRQEVKCLFDTNTMVVMLNSNVVGQQVFTQPLVIPDLNTIRIGNSWNNTLSFNGEYHLFNLSSTPIEGI